MKYIKDEDIETLKLDINVLDQIIRNIGLQNAELGGVLGGKESYASNFYFDNGGVTTSSTYTPNQKRINNLFKNDWNPNGIRMLGFPHSHPGSHGYISKGDIEYATNILSNVDDCNILWVPIINTIAESDYFSLIPWYLKKRGKDIAINKGYLSLYAGKLKSVESRELKKLFYNEIMKSSKIEVLMLRSNKVEKLYSKRIGMMKNKSKEAGTGMKEQGDKSFDRIKGLYDLHVMKNSVLIIVGVGGAAEWVEQMARSSVSHFILIDPDTIEESNIATQQVYRKDIGRKKVKCLKDRILDINPDATVKIMSKKFQDIEDVEIKEKLKVYKNRLDDPRFLICGFTDDFYAQARVNRISLDLGIPSLCAQVYKEGRGAEITFTYPGITKACHRCILSKRYDYILNNKPSEKVTSHSTPIFATNRLNSIKGYVALAILHDGSSNKRWGKMLQRIGNRNLIQIRMDPDFSSELGIKTFDKTFDMGDKEKLFFDETLWLEQEPECDSSSGHVCPDCKGLGDLRELKNSFSDTRIIN